MGHCHKIYNIPDELGQMLKIRHHIPLWGPNYRTEQVYQLKKILLAIALAIM